MKEGEASPVEDEKALEEIGRLLVLGGGDSVYNQAMVEKVVKKNEAEKRQLTDQSSQEAKQ